MHNTLFLSGHGVAGYASHTVNCSSVYHRSNCVVWLKWCVSAADRIPIPGRSDVRFLFEVCVSIDYCSLLDVQTLLDVCVRIDGLFPCSLVCNWLVESSDSSDSSNDWSQSSSRFTTFPRSRLVGLYTRCIDLHALPVCPALSLFSKALDSSALAPLTTNCAVKWFEKQTILMELITNNRASFYYFFKVRTRSCLLPYRSWYRCGQLNLRIDLLRLGYWLHCSGRCGT
jgi:hypothetical protein